MSPLDTAIYWTEYVLRHDGAYHLQTPGRHMGWARGTSRKWSNFVQHCVFRLHRFMQYYSLDVMCFIIAALLLVRFAFKRYLLKASTASDVKLKTQWSSQQVDEEEIDRQSWKICLFIFAGLFSALRIYLSIEHFFYLILIKKIKSNQNCDWQKYSSISAWADALRFPVQLNKSTLKTKRHERSLSWLTPREFLMTSRTRETYQLRKCVAQAHSIHPSNALGHDWSIRKHLSALIKR